MSFFEQNDNPPCQWMYNLEENCKEKKLLMKIMLTSAISYCIISLNGIIVLLWKAYLRYKKSEKLRWSSLEYVWAWAFVFCILRSFNNFTVVYDLFPNRKIFRLALFAISWIPGYLGMYVYIAGIFRTIPRLSFNRLTYESQSGNSLWLPNSKQVKPIMWMISLFTTVGIISSSLLSGYYFGEGKSDEMIIAFSVQMALLWIGSVICWFSLFYYGRALVSLMQVFNYAFGGTFFLFSMFLIPITIWYKVTMLELFIVNLLYCLTCNIFSVSMVTIVGIVLMYSEILTNTLERKAEWTDQNSTWMQLENNTFDRSAYSNQSYSIYAEEIYQGQ
ncbi:423_t:CDS:2 [Funneliformis geosporum]|uniref:12181_t:CDS:1 n=1 Tax=Funneliformis geosporum TaxID=1117311 RepID=A0A9W4SIA2_9GLOM|nr:12181_t:CDS:2 [Funneliformis geosporum]CAI2170636.1 423_t:CDS:2 [Funneliformis geosporum]